MSCSDFSDDSLEQSSSKDEIKYDHKKISLTKYQSFKCCDIMSVPLYSGPVSLHDIKRIEVNGVQILTLTNADVTKVCIQKCY